eukprot:1196129-Prorocentrum_minimum.AAC.10
MAVRWPSDNHSIRLGSTHYLKQTPNVRGNAANSPWVLVEPSAETVAELADIAPDWTADARLDAELAAPAPPATPAARAQSTVSRSGRVASPVLVVMPAHGDDAKRPLARREGEFVSARGEFASAHGEFASAIGECASARGEFAIACGERYEFASARGEFASARQRAVSL